MPRIIIAILIIMAVRPLPLCEGGGVLGLQGDAGLPCCRHLQGEASPLVEAQGGVAKMLSKVLAEEIEKVTVPATTEGLPPAPVVVESPLAASSVPATLANTLFFISVLFRFLS